MSQQEIAHILNVMSSRDVDPFGEHRMLRFERQQRLLGAEFRFRSNSRALMRLVEHAYAGLPVQAFEREAPKLNVTLLLEDAQSPGSKRGEPELLHLKAGGGLLAASTRSSDYTVLAPGAGSALVALSKSLLRFPYHARYELIEFAVFTLAARAQDLVPLHAACVGLDGRGVLLMGDSGAGKSTVSLECLQQGFEFLSEDSVFVQSATLRATGVANFLHVRADALRWVRQQRIAAAIRRAPVIRRRSGEKKFEMDLRRAPFKLAAAPLQLSAIVFLSTRPARAGDGPLQPLQHEEALRRLAALQSYGAALPHWPAFAKKARKLAMFELRRGKHPSESAAALRAILA